jgi:hypothetical protein
MECDERARLLNAHNKAALEFSIAIDELLVGVGGRSSLVYDLRRRAAERARAEFEPARSAYETHVGEHGCETSNFLGTKAVNSTDAKTSWPRTSPSAVLPAEHGFDPLRSAAIRLSRISETTKRD